MKKKFLSLLMAGAMVVGATMPASASTNQTVGGNDTEVHDANVKVTGTVTKKDGTAAAGRIQVEIPTALTFAVDQSGNFKAPTFTITNRSSCSVDVLVGSFRETIKDGGITVQPKTENLADKDRSNVQLRLKGEGQEVDLGGQLTGTEVLSVIPGGQSSQIQVLGDAGKKNDGTADVDTKGASENFDLVFKIKKS